jgi:MFS family permease
MLCGSRRVAAARRTRACHRQPPKRPEILPRTSHRRRRALDVAVTLRRHHLHGDDRQPAIRLDAVRQCRSTQKYHWGRAAIQVAFTIFVLTETWLVPIEGWFVDKFGPRIMIVVLIGGVLCRHRLGDQRRSRLAALLYLGAAIGGIGAGAVYGTCVGNALKWFPDRRGLAPG